MEFLPETIAGIVSIAIASFLVRVVVGIVFKIIILVAALVIILFLYKSATGMDLAPGADMLSSFL